jgi:ABC-2 type transport system permease protein
MFIKLVAANLKELIRDKMYLFWFLVFPLVFVFVFGVLFAGKGSPFGNGAEYRPVFDIGVASKSGAPLEETAKKGFEDVLKEAGAFTFHHGGKDNELEAFKKGKRHALLLVPDRFVRDIQAKEPAPIDLYFDVNRVEVLFAVSEIVSVLENKLRGQTKLVKYNLTSSIQVNQKHSTVGLSKIDYLLPGLLALTLMQLGLFGSIRILALKSQQILKGLAATPMPRATFLASEVTVRLLLSLIQGTIILLLGHYIFGLTLAGSWFVILGLVLLGTSVFIALGYALTSLVNNPDSGNALMQVIQFPMMFLSGVFFSIEMMPAFIRPVSNFIPLTYVADALRSALTGAPSGFGMAVNVLVMAGLTMACMVVAVMTFKWE